MKVLKMSGYGEKIISLQIFMETAKEFFQKSEEKYSNEDFKGGSVKDYTEYFGCLTSCFSSPNQLEISHDL